MNVKFSHPINELLFFLQSDRPIYYGPITYDTFLREKKAQEERENREMVDLFLKEIDKKYNEDKKNCIEEKCIECDKNASSICKECGVRLCINHIRHGLLDVKCGDDIDLCKECESSNNVEHSNALFGCYRHHKNMTSQCYGLY